MKAILSFTVAVSVCLGGTARASAIVYENLPDTSASAAGWNSNLGFGQQIAEDFRLAGAAILDEVTFWGYLNAADQTTSFDILLFEDVSGLPAGDPFERWTTPALTGVDTGLTALNGRAIYEWSASIPAVSLPGGTDFWISIVGPGYVDDPRFVWFHGQVDSGHPLVWRGDEGSDWMKDFEQPADGYSAPAFRLRGVPEPAVLLLLGVGVAALWSRRAMLR